MKRLHYTIEKFLYRKGFASPLVRHMLTTHILLTGVAASLGVLLCWLTLWPLLFTVGAFIAGYNLWHTSRFVQGTLLRKYTPGAQLKLFFTFTLRLMCTGIILFVLIVQLGQPVVPLIAGLTSTVAGIALWGFSKASRKPAKEA